jgi:hypothetical protein
MARIITGILERVDPEQQAVLVGAVLLRVSRPELMHGLKEGMSVTVRCEHSGEQTWATAVTPRRKPLSATEPAGGAGASVTPHE